MRNLLLINQGLSANLGDKAIMYSLRKYFESAGFNVDFMGFTQFVESDIEDNGWKTYKQIRKLDLPVKLKWALKAKKRVISEIDKIKTDYDAVVIGGGQLIKTDCYFPYAMMEWVKKVVQCSKTTFLIGVGADTSFSKSEIRSYKNAFKMVDGVVVRDSQSQKVLHDIFDVESDIMPDVAFLLGLYFSEHKPKKNMAIVMPFDYFTYRYHFHNIESYEKYSKMWVDIIRLEINKKNNVKLMYTTMEDKRECYNVLNQLNNREKEQVNIASSSSINDFIMQLSEAGELFTGRMHALILGMIAGCNVKPIVVSKKIEAFEKEYILKGYNVNEYALRVKKKLDFYFGGLLDE